MSDAAKRLVYYYDTKGRRLMIDEVSRLPAVGEVLDLYKGCTGRVLKVSEGELTDFGYPVTRIEIGGV